MTLQEIQKTLKAPKSNYNSFGKYYYRSCEDILEAVKPLLGESVLTISDEIIMLGDRFYVKATATLIEGDKALSVVAYAREAGDKKGMDDAQITGSASSYARKYALNGLFLIDDNKDADSQDNSVVDISKKSQQVNNQPNKMNEHFYALLDGMPMQAVNEWETKWSACKNDEERTKVGIELKAYRVNGGPW